jgi:hypothetical protein
MMIAVVLGSHLDVFPAQIEIGDRATKVVEYRNLRLWSRQASPYQQQAKPGLLGRLSAGVR